jgi:hypothetical protein
LLRVAEAHVHKPVGVILLQVAAGSHLKSDVVGWGLGRGCCLILAVELVEAVVEIV